MYYESEILELKEKYTDVLVKDIVAFLNTKGGNIYIGIKDNGDIIGIPKNELDEVQKKLSDCIMSQIEPTPLNEINVNVINEQGKNIINISIVKGIKPIYCIKKYGFSSKGCFIRIGTTCREIDNNEIEKRYKNNFIDDNFILKSPAKYLPLSFDIMKVLLTSKGFHINSETFESNFSLFNKNGEYNLMAEILADKNMVPMILVKFRGYNKASIAQRSDYGSQSILIAYQRLKDRLIAENICITDTTIRPRIDKYLYDMDCVGEALVNAIVHNDWTISEPLVALYSDRLEITSHGGIPKEISKDDFFNGVSHPRNSVLMRIFLKLGIVEHTGHGIPKIIEKYGKEVFDIHDTYINVVIPFNKEVLKSIDDYSSDKIINKNGAEIDGKNVAKMWQKSCDNNDKLLDDYLINNERKVINEIMQNPRVNYDKLVDKLKISRRTISRIFSSLTNKGYIVRVGTNKNGYWKIVKET